MYAFAQQIKGLVASEYAGGTGPERFDGPGPVDGLEHGDDFRAWVRSPDLARQVEGDCSSFFYVSADDYNVDLVLAKPIANRGRICRVAGQGQLIWAAVKGS